MVELFLHSPVCFHTIVLSYLSTGTTLPRTLPYLTYISYMFEVSDAAKSRIVIFWLVTPCNVVGEHLHFGGTYRLSLQDRPYYKVYVRTPSQISHD
jgi:hypothetical protein